MKEFWLCFVPLFVAVDAIGVLPMFKPADMELLKTYSLPGQTNGHSVVYAMEEQHEVGLRVTDLGEVVFFSTGNGDVREQINLNIPAGTSITSVSSGDPDQRMIGLGLSNGNVILFQHNYAVTFPNDIRLITPSLFFPFGEEPLQVPRAGPGGRRGARVRGGAHPRVPLRE